MNSTTSSEEWMAFVPSSVKSSSAAIHSISTAVCLNLTLLPFIHYLECIIVLSYHPLDDHHQCWLESVLLQYFAYLNLFQRLDIKRLHGPIDLQLDFRWRLDFFQKIAWLLKLIQKLHNISSIIYSPIGEIWAES